MRVFLIGEKSLLNSADLVFMNGDALIQMLRYISQSAVTRNDCTSAINNVLEAVSTAPVAPDGKSSTTLSRVFEITLSTLKQSANNERLWFNTYVRYAKCLMRQQHYSLLQGCINELAKSCRLENGSLTAQL